jgi:1A family penicillin-binding protein
VAKKFGKLFYTIWGLVIIGVIFCASIVIFWMATLKIPDVNSFNEKKLIQSTRIYDRTEKVLLWDVNQNIKRTVIQFDKISKNLKNATVAIEDSNFYNHKGIDIKAIFRALLVDVLSGKMKQGASTISQQVVKNTFLTNEKSITRKIKEAILTLKIEKVMSKEDILNLYLNEIPYGGSNYGIEAASQNFLGKSANELNLAESAYLAAVPQSPTYYSPYGNHKQELENRKNFVLDRMAELNFINKEEADAAKKEKVNFIGKGDNSLKAPHFSVYIRSYLEKKYGKDVVEEDGLKVITTLDYTLQQTAEGVVSDYAKTIKENFNASNAALVAIDPKTGQILAMVGSKNYFNMQEEGNFNVALAHRQPGSSIKPFVYATAFKKGYTPDTILFNLQTEFNPSCYPDGTPHPGVDPEHCYMPQNYNEVYSGPMILRNALAQSVNVVSVKTLYLASLNDSLKTISDFGVTSLNEPDRYGLTLVLGGGEVSLLEMTGAYSVLANQGVRNPVIGILKVEDNNGNILEQYIPNPQEVLDKNITLTITDILSDNNARTPAFGSNSPLYFSERPVAAKTGTTNDYHDTWTFGYTPNITVGVWVGNNNNAPMARKVASSIASPLWHNFLTEVFKTLPVETFEKPQPMPEPKPVLAGQWNTLPIHDILYWVDKNNPLGPQPGNPSDDSQYYNWEYPVQKWAKQNGY